jgi:formylglycine-generating enzyme required for sulfatase activity
VKLVTALSIVALLGVALSARAEEEADAGAPKPCPAEMVEVDGNYCTDLEQKCVRWMSENQGGGDRCAEFAASVCKSTTTHKHFCIDKFEYPNKRGTKPAVMKTWLEASAICKASGKRLCGDSEWTLACEGAHQLPYPYGRKRDSNKCNIDHKLPEVDPGALIDPSRREAEVQRLWQGEPSGTRPECSSTYGVFDLTGNVDEWVVNESGKPFRSGSKGGYWGPVRARCRPMTTGHAESFPFYQTGFRCCSDPH